MKLGEIINILKNATAGTAKVLKGVKHLTPLMISKTSAYRLYGRSNVDRWISEGLIKISDKKLDRAQLEAIGATSNRTTYLPVAER